MDEININQIFDLGYFIKGTDMYIPLDEYLEIFPNERENWLPNMTINTYVIMSTHPSTDEEKNKIKELIKYKNKSKILKLK